MASSAGTKKRLPEEIIGTLRGRILSGEIQPGERLPPERELALMLSTNRNTLREALRALESQGLVKARQGDGVRVVDFRRHGEFPLLAPYFQEAEGEERVEMLADLLRIRRLVATEAVVQAAERATAAEVDRLEKLLDGLLAAHGNLDMGDVADKELGLYRAITEASDSLVGLWLFNSLEKVVREFLRIYPNIWVTPPSYVKDWRAIVGGIADQSADKARAAVEHLLKETDDIVVALTG